MTDKEILIEDLDHLEREVDALTSDKEALIEQLESIKNQIEEALTKYTK
jgi:chaperonin cofactor prefoldin